MDDSLSQLYGNRRVRERGPNPRLLDSEVLTLEVIGEYLGTVNEDDRLSPRLTPVLMKQTQLFVQSLAQLLVVGIVNALAGSEASVFDGANYIVQEINCLATYRSTLRIWDVGVVPDDALGKVAERLSQQR